MEFPCNINVLIASEGRSLLPVRTDRDEACFPPLPQPTLPLYDKERVGFPSEPRPMLEVVSSRCRAAIGQLQQNLQPTAFARVALCCEQPKECAVCYSCVLV